MPTLTRINVFPIKSLDGFDVPYARVLPSGSLESDRSFALVDENNHYVNGKRFPKLLRIRALYSAMLKHVTLRYGDLEKTFSLADEREEIARWCGNLLKVECRLLENTETGFPDDPESSGPTLISSGSLKAICGWFPSLDLGETRRRFRANLEVAAEPFWEDRLLSAANPSRRFCIGATRWWADKICQRCAVPTRGSRDGDAIEGFAKRFTAMREQELPRESPRQEFDHFYRLAINTRLASMEGDSSIRIGDEVAPVGETTP